ncbi:tetratricopeptide repeat protein [Granulosicoccus antarcticus]|uniref:Uncharacterized protein n=1 Tax=Granulosicoccus antarcticus IMCC3135 TaxID=1192854 RepID=A0A2Z2NPH0_9GAMM|nr:tetratricopeptide repeat protein [Granulosicoccus antarcticus]ASJ73382.1 hypothetical protein IMCC3135_16500 [Granulosicoccus antarcticus IMCC3135]
MLRWLRSTELRSVACTIGLVLVTGGVFSGVALGDQTAPELPGLFEQLLDARDDPEVQALENEIWRHWLVAPDPISELLMSRISRAMAVEELDVALRLCNQLVESAPDFAEGWNRRATLHYLMGDFNSSVADIGETLIREPRHFGAISGLGLIFMRQNKLEAALEVFEQVLIISPGSVSASRNAERILKALSTEI